LRGSDGRWPFRSIRPARATITPRAMTAKKLGLQYYDRTRRKKEK
jgi:hypothetical protein